MTAKETHADKIAKLLRKAESTTPEEAEMLYAKAQELMAKYAIDEAMLQAARGLQGQEDDPILKEEFVLVSIWRFPMVRLTHYVLISNGIKDVKLHDPGWRTIDGRTYKETEVIVGVGLKSDLERARILQMSLMLQALRAENAWWQENEVLYRSFTKSQQHRARRGFLFAFAEGVYKKLSEATARGRKAAEEEHTADSVAIVLRDKSLAVQDEFAKHFPALVKTKDRMQKGDAFARGSGYAAGQRADVGQGTLGGNRKALR